MGRQSWLSTYTQLPTDLAYLDATTMLTVFSHLTSTEPNDESGANVDASVSSV